MGRSESKKNVSRENKYTKKLALRGQFFVFYSTEKMYG